MRMLEPDGRGQIVQLQLYLSLSEAQDCMKELDKLIADPEAMEHFHLFSRDGGAELSVSIVTRAKLAGGGYAREELEAFGNWKPGP